jgi:hypothetical protein
VLGGLERLANKTRGVRIGEVSRRNASALFQQREKPAKPEGRDGF